MKLSPTSREGFTLIELLLVIGIIAILAAIVIVAVNPQKQMQDARNAQRRADVNTIINGIYQYAIDNAALPSCIQAEGSSTGVAICTDNDCGAEGIESASGCALLHFLSGTYLAGIPSDPSASSLTYSAYQSGYEVQLQGSNRVRVDAPLEEGTADIFVIR